MTQYKSTGEPDWLALAGIDPPTVQQCVESRRVELRNLLMLIDGTIQLNQNVLATRVKRWKRESAAANVAALTALKLEVVEEMKDEALMRHCENLAKGQFDFGAFLHLTYGEVFERAPPGHVNQDMRWLAHGSMWANEWIDIVVGRRPLRDLEQWLPGAIAEVEDKAVRSILNVFPNVGIDVLDKALAEAKAGSYLIANILLLPFLESFVREGCRVVRKHQQPECSAEAVDIEINDRHTLGALVDWTWSQDIDVNMLDLIVSHRATSTHAVQDELARARRARQANREIRKAVEELHGRIQSVANGQQEWEPIKEDVMAEFKRMEELGASLMEDPKTINVKLGLNSLLNFLVRRHTDDRNQVLHGHFAEFREAWRTYTYLRAIVHTTGVFAIYREQHRLFMNPL